MYGPKASPHPNFLRSLFSKANELITQEYWNGDVVVQYNIGYHWGMLLLVNLINQQPGLLRDFIFEKGDAGLNKFRNL